MVFVWHFTHATAGYPTPFEGAPLLAILDEGHTGVSLFMALSGYLFAKLLDGRSIKYIPFFWNRFLRLAPLLVVSVALSGFQLYLAGLLDPWEYARKSALGLVTTRLPNGAWSVVVEGHFYVLLPFLLYATRRWKPAPLAFLLIAIALRTGLYGLGADIQPISYKLIVGRIDQFLLGIAAFNYRHLIGGKTALAAGSALMIGYWLFDWAGGLTHLPEKLDWLWIILPTFDAVTYCLLIAWYDNRGPVGGRLAWAAQKAGEYSYSIYLLHFFIVFIVADSIHRKIMDISNFYVALPWALLTFAGMTIIGHFSFKYIESPFLAFRRTYITKPASM